MKRRHEFYLDGEVSERLAALAAKPGSSKSAIMTDAVRAYFNRRGASELDDRFKIRLDKLSMQLGRIERYEHVVAETLALFVRYQLMVTGPQPEADHATRLLVQERFQAFVNQVGRRLSNGHGLIDDVLSQASSSESQ